MFQIMQFKLLKIWSAIRCDCFAHTPNDRRRLWNDGRGYLLDLKHPLLAPPPVISPIHRSVDNPLFHELWPKLIIFDIPQYHTLRLSQRFYLQISNPRVWMYVFAVCMYILPISSMAKKSFKLEADNKIFTGCLPPFVTSKTVISIHLNFNTTIKCVGIFFSEKFQHTLLSHLSGTYLVPVPYPVYREWYKINRLHWECYYIFAISGGVLI